MSAVLVYKRKGVFTITINRPEYLNVLDSQVLDALRNSFEAAEKAPDVRVVILTGAGKRAFIAGADIREMAKMKPAQAEAYSKKGQALTTYIEQFPKPVIAAVNGYALGGGCEFAMACHIRYASENAQFAQPEVGLGVIPGFGGSQRLPRLVGKGVAFEMLLTGKMINAKTAQQIGLVNKVVPLSNLMTSVKKLADQITHTSPTAAEMIIKVVNQGADLTLVEGLTFEAKQFGRIFSTEDQREGMQAFIDKRKPAFRK
ncbi:MAG: hypothetical protein GXO91_00180 [FCB group bacterium]|nr:hypothetical protein [FCB group bacterium]